MDRNEFLKHATIEITTALRQGMCPWRMPWHGGENSGLPENVATRKLCRGTNWLLLQLAAQRNGFKAKWWNTQRQWELLDGWVLPGARGTTIYFPPKGELVLFNAEQVADVPSFQAGPPRPATDEDYERAEMAIEATGAQVRHRCGLQAFYVFPPEDYIVLPLKSQFLEGPGGLPAYYDTAFHELTHWTSTRLNWHDHRAAMHELRSEMGAPLLASLIGIPNVTDLALVPNHRRYVPEWCAAMEKDHTLLEQVANSIWASAEFILPFQMERIAA